MTLWGLIELVFFRKEYLHQVDLYIANWDGTDMILWFIRDMQFPNVDSQVSTVNIIPTGSEPFS